MVLVILKLVYQRTLISLKMVIIYRTAIFIGRQNVMYGGCNQTW